MKSCRFTSCLTKNLPDVREGQKLMSGPHGHVDEELDVSESFDRYGDELAIVVDEDWAHQIVNPRTLSPTVGINVDGINRR